MNTEILRIKNKYRETFKNISTIISWTVFVLLLICAAFLIYYFIALQIYKTKGAGYEPKFSLYTIASPSMVPNINVYDVVIDTKVKKPEDIKINDVITFNSSLPGVSGGTITHRVIAINKDSNGNYYYQTKGDNNLVEDNVKVTFKDIVGKVSLRIPKLGRIQGFVATKAGWLIIILIPALYIIVKDILKVLKLKDGYSKFKNFINKPLFQKQKLLPYTPPSNDKLQSDLTPHLNNPEPNASFDKPYFDVDDDFDLDDLPQLK